MRFSILVTGLCALLIGIELAAAGNEPVIRINRMDSPPAIDGDGNEPAWQQNAVIQDFLALNGAPVPEAVTVHLGYDGEYLYLYAELEEPILSDAAQRRHEIRTDAREDNSTVFSNDNLTLFLQSGNKQNAPVYEWNINPSGQLADARSSRNNLWDSRDFSWNSEARVATRMEDGYWKVEMAIPWKSLEYNPEIMEPLRLGLAWHAAARGTVTSWHPLNGAIHRPSAFGWLYLSENLPAFQRNSQLTVLEPGNNELLFQFGPASKSVQRLELRSRLTIDQKVSVQRQAVSLNQVTQEIELPVQTPKEGRNATLQWEVVHSQTLETLYSSPQITLRVENSFARLKIETTDSWKVHYGTELLAEGRGTEQVRIPLREGLYSLQVESMEDARLVLEGTPDGANFSWHKSVSPDGNTIYKHQLLHRHSRHYPQHEPALHLVRGHLQGLWIKAAAPMNSNALQDWSLHLVLPEGVELVGVSGFYGKTMSGKALFSFEALPLTDSRQGHHYRITADKPLPAWQATRHHLYQFVWVGIRLREDADTLPSSAEISYWMEGENGNLTETPWHVPLAVLPPLQGAQPKKLHAKLWLTEGFGMDDDPLYQTLYASTANAGFTEILGRPPAKQLSHLQQVQLIYFRNHAISKEIGEWLEKNPDARLIDREGKPHATLLCTTLMLGDQGWSAVEQIVENFINQRKPDILEYDYEYPPFVGPHSCYCPLCLTAFSTFANVPLESLDLKEEEHGAQGEAWVHFMAERVARIARKLKETANQHDVAFHFYSGYHTTENARRYGVDWEQIGQLQAADVAGVGYGRPGEAIDATIKALDGIPLMLGVLLQPSVGPRLEQAQPSSQPEKAEILRRFLDGTGGILVYNSINADGRMWQAVAETTRLVAQYETHFLSRQLESLPGHSPVDVQILHGEKDILLCIMNHHQNPRKFNVTIPETLGSGYEFYTGAKITSGMHFNEELPPGDTRVLILTVP